MNRTSCLLAITITLILPLGCFADMYEYTDNEGVVHLTDDPGKVPAKLRNSSKKDTSSATDVPNKPEHTIQTEKAKDAPVSAAPADVQTDSFVLQNATSATLDLWRDNRVDQLYDRLVNRGNMPKAQFAEKLQATSIRPACCWQKLDGFEVLFENSSGATVTAKIGIEVTDYIIARKSNTVAKSFTSVEYITREFRLLNEGGLWKMQLNDILSLRDAARESRDQRDPGSL